MKDLVRKAGREKEFYIESAATSTEELGNPVYPPARDELRRHGIECKGHHARQVRPSDYDNFDYIIAMEDIHYRIMRDRFFGGRADKISLCMGEIASHQNKQLLQTAHRRGEIIIAQLIDTGSHPDSLLGICSLLGTGKGRKHKCLGTH